MACFRNETKPVASKLGKIKWCALKRVQSELDYTQLVIPCFLLDHQDHTLFFCLSLSLQEWVSCGEVETSKNMWSVEGWLKIPSSAAMAKSNTKNAGIAQTEKQNSGQYKGYIPTSPPR